MLINDNRDIMVRISAPENITNDAQTMLMSFLKEHGIERKALPKIFVFIANNYGYKRFTSLNKLIDGSTEKNYFRHIES